MIKSAVAQLSPGEVSDVIPTASGGIVAVFEQREPPDMGCSTIGKMMLNSQYLNTKREVAFYEWLRERRREAGVQSNPG